MRGTKNPIGAAITRQLRLTPGGGADTAVHTAALMQTGCALLYACEPLITAVAARSAAARDVVNAPMPTSRALQTKADRQTDDYHSSLVATYTHFPFQCAAACAKH